MPTYSYACKNCGHAFDIHQAFTDDSLTVCPECQGTLRKVFGNVGVTFKGSGFYATDSRSSGGSRAAAKSGGSESGSKDAAAAGGSTGAPSGSSGSGSSDSGTSSTSATGDSSSSSSKSTASPSA